MVDFLRKKRQLLSFLIHASDLFSRFHWISSGIFIAPDAETTGEKGSELHLSQRVCVAGSSPKWPFVFSSSSPNWKQINHFRKNHEKPFQLVRVHQKVWPLGGSGNFAETVWPWMRLALGVSFKSRPRNHANRLTKVTSLDTMRKVRGCWMLPSFRNQPHIFHTSLKRWKKPRWDFSKPPLLRKLLGNLQWSLKMHQSRFLTHRIMDASTGITNLRQHSGTFRFMLCIIKHRDSRRNRWIYSPRLKLKLSETLFWSIWA